MYNNDGVSAGEDEVSERDEVIPPGDDSEAGGTEGGPAVPPYVETLAWILDDWFRIPLTNKRVGIDGAIGMVPVVGDGAGLVTSAIVIVSAVGQGVSVPTVIRMVGNVLFDSMLGVVPFMGDAFDFAWKSNAKNVRLLKAALAVPLRTRRSSLAVMAISVGVVLVLTAATVAAAALGLWLMVRLGEAIF